MKKVFSAPQDDALFDYVTDTFRPEDAVLAEIRERSLKAGLPAIQVGSSDGLHLEILTRLAHVEKAVEIGTLGGYSGVSIARGLPHHGKLHTFDISEVHAKVAAESFKKAGLETKVEIHVGPALDLLPTINKHGPFDLVFVDADKVNYPSYLKWATENLRVGGLLIGDNTFAFGKIAEVIPLDDPDWASVEALRAFNLELATGGRFRATILPTGEGMTVAVKVR